jgi:hypothetical protein
LTEDDVKAGKPLADVLRQFDTDVVQQALGGDRNFTLVSCLLSQVWRVEGSVRVAIFFLVFEPKPEKCTKST